MFGKSLKVAWKISIQNAYCSSSSDISSYYSNSNKYDKCSVCQTECKNSRRKGKKLSVGVRATNRFSCLQFKFNFLAYKISRITHHEVEILNKSTCQTKTNTNTRTTTKILIRLKTTPDLCALCIFSSYK